MRWYACWLADLRSWFRDKRGDANWQSSAANLLAAMTMVNVICVGYLVNAAWITQPSSKVARAVVMVVLFFLLDGGHRAAIRGVVKHFDLDSLPRAADRPKITRVWTYVVGTLFSAVVVVVLQL